MQTFKDGEVNCFEAGELDELTDELSSKIDNDEADGGVIAKQPERGQRVEINGLKYEVQAVIAKGKVVLEPLGK